VQAGRGKPTAGAVQNTGNASQASCKRACKTGRVLSGLELRVLGGIEVLRDGNTVAIGGPKPRLVLAMLLAARGTVVSAARLCEELWGDQQPADPGAVLQSHLSRLRKLLRPEVDIVGRPPGYLIEEDAERLDAARFEALCERAHAARDPQLALEAFDGALACFRGSAFEEFATTEWARSEAVRLDELHVNAREDRIDARLGLGDHAALVPELEALVALHPFRERPWQQLAIALYRSGRAADALRRVSTLQTTMREELGLDLSPAMRELEQRILTDDPTLLVAPSDARGVRPRRTPSPSPPLVGRQSDLDRVAAQLRTQRLVTLTGPGGVGKTRLALRLAAELWDELRGEVFVVELAPVHDPASTVAAIATAIDVQQRQHLSLEETLFEYLRGRRGLLVLDNCEHLRAPIASLVQRLLDWCNEITVLATSREVLGLPGEQVARVEPLAVAGSEDDVATIARAPAVQLFVERAAEARAGFAVDEENAAAVAAIAARVDGLPLALELAAARMRVMSPAALAERLDQSLDLLSGAQTSMIPRHRTLDQLVTWSHDLLERDEQLLFARLCVFAGDFGLDAVESGCAGDDLDAATVSLVLANLVDKSMVQLSDPDLPRYRLLESLREFGDERLSEAERRSVGARHAHWYLDVAERCGAALATDREGKAVAMLDRDFDNLRAAHAWAVEHGDIDVALRLVAALREYCTRSMRAEVIGWADEVLQLEGAESHPRAPVVCALAAYGRFVRGDLDDAIALALRALTMSERSHCDTSGLAERTLGNALFYRGEVESATQYMDRMVASARDGSSARLAHALYMRSVAYTSIGDEVKGAQLAGEARAAARAAGSPTATAQASYALGLSLERSDPVDAAAHLERAVHLARDAGNRWIEAFALTEVLWLQARQGQARAALARYDDVIDLWYRGGDWVNQWLSLRHVFGIFVDLNDHSGAATLHGALSAAGAAYALPFQATDAVHLSNLVGDLREHLGAATFAAAVRRGAAMSDAEIVDFVRERIDALS
jgi:predicted ATPase/DNA-binding SARP family transcriptional activator